ncbi:hypothetical protein [Methylobacterium iners]|uniref:Uncharacterized protein n=1 Tax=Methylobacterium iners TaxID=418707 RepID=A0ABQ4S4A2_9HYPH|nr:hypothetical protein [Methylobacterium iners]GJD97741.1 hypothetical protein OCOJLMKI_4974 [Methylobacterium iners]
MPAEFTCCECGRGVTDVTNDEPPAFRLCLFCLHHPGWFRDPRLRAFMDADHDGAEHGMDHDDAE